MSSTPKLEDLVSLAAAFKNGMQGHKASSAVTVDESGTPILANFLQGQDTGLEIVFPDDKHGRLIVPPRRSDVFQSKLNQRMPGTPSGKPYERWCSFNNDEGYVVYFCQNDKSKVQMLDGTRIAVLIASFLEGLLENSGLANKIKLGIVESLYANSATVDFVTKKKKIICEFADPGMQHFKSAAEKYDIGVHFDLTGEGSITFSEATLKAIRDEEPQARLPSESKALETLRAISDIFSLSVSDPLRVFLLVELVLAHRSWTTKDWLSMYDDYPSALAMVAVVDQSIFRVAMMDVIEPEGLQRRIESAALSFNGVIRCFARPSATGNMIVVYGEAANPAVADKVVLLVCEHVYDMGNGRGPRPEIEYR